MNSNAPVPDTSIATLGERRIRSPLTLSTVPGDGIGNFVLDEARVRFRNEVGTRVVAPDLLFEKAGPREWIYFDPAHTRAGIVTCGGLCPGLNNVIRSISLELIHNYGVTEILGFRYGYGGLDPDSGLEPLRLTAATVGHIHREGGTIIGTCRGGPEVSAIVDTLERERINLLFSIGGDGTQRGTHAIAGEARRRGLPLAVVGVPKTIDNDIEFVHRTFGFATAVDEARRVLSAAHSEATSARNGVGLVKVMGRDSGFIACGATLVSQDVDFCLIPELPLVLDGEQGFLATLRRRVTEAGHALIVVAEGVGQDLCGGGDPGVDASGNRLHRDIGPLLCDRIRTGFAEHGLSIDLKYIDPSYIIRSRPANSGDSFLCDQYARDAVHAAMAGKSDLIIGHWSGSFMHVPIEMATSTRQTVDPEGDLWESVIAATRQPRVWR